MIGALSNWLDHRTGYKKFLHLMLIEQIPGGAKWRYVWGSCLAFVFAIQVITGVLLMTAYSPGDVSAWGSVYFIQYEMDFGWLIRGLHHFGSQTMVVLLALHMLQVVIAGAHLPPREVNWWLGIGLLSATLGLSLTGYLLPWDQKGYFATQVATNIAAKTPVLGESLQKFLVGGPTYGNHTLTRFFTLHVWILPISMIGMIVLHLVAFRRHGVTAPANAKGTGWFWPDQAFRDLVVCLVIFGIMVSLVVFGGHGTKIETPAAEDGKTPTLYERWAHAGKEGRGANLDAPADPDTQGYPARPEWYFLFLFQLLKYFEGPKILIGTFVIPNAALALLTILPLLGYGRMRKFGHYFGILVVGGLLLGVGALTILAIADDSPTPYPMGLGGGTDKAKDLAKKFDQARIEAERAIQLAATGTSPEPGMKPIPGIPPEGPREMVRKDPLLRGSKLFESNCAGCHSYTPPDPKSPFRFNDPAKVKYQASDLHDYASEKWVRGLLTNPGDATYFGRTELTGMKSWRAKIEKKREKWDEAKKAEQEAEFDLIAKFLAQQKKSKKDAEIEKKGLEAFGEQCANCHKFGKEGGEQGPDLTGYGTADWMRLMIMAPDHYARFGKKNTMPAFRNLQGPGGEVAKFEFSEFYKKDDNARREPQVLHLSDVDREMIIRFVTGDHWAIFGGTPIK